MLRRYQDCDGGSKHEHLSTLPRIRSPDSTSDETGDAFAGGKWPEFGFFVRAEVSAVSNVCAKELAVVSSVSGEAVGGCCEAAVAPVSAKKFALQAKKGRFWGVLRALGELFRVWTLMEASRANFFALVGPSCVSGDWLRCPWWCRWPASEKSHAIRLGEVSIKPENVAIPTI